VSLQNFSRSWLDGLNLYWSWYLVIGIVATGLIVSLAFSAAASVNSRYRDVIVASGVGVLITAMFIAGYGNYF
jgi:formate-dependent nitrite reductase membrane component NrfD